MLKILEIAPEGNVPTTLDELAREGARRMLVEALDAEVADYLKRHRAQRGEDGRALVVRNGKGRPRPVTTGAGTVGVQAPRVHDRRSGHRFTSSILPPYMCRSPKVSEVLPVLLDVHPGKRQPWSRNSRARRIGGGMVRVLRPTLRIRPDR